MVFCICCILVTHADESRGSKAFIRVCLFVCVSVCVCLFVRTIELKRLKLYVGLQSPNLPQ